MERLSWILTITCSVALMLFLVGCTDEAETYDGTNVGPDATSDVFVPDTVINPDGKQVGEGCTTDNECYFNKCIDGFCSEGKEVGEPCTENNHCKLNKCIDSFCSEGKAIGEACQVNNDCKDNKCNDGLCVDPTLIIVNECNWVDKPDDCVSWKCYYEDGSTICRHNSQEVPNSAYDWRCYDTEDQTICVHQGDVPNNEFFWECATNGGTTVCTYTGDGTGSSGDRNLNVGPGWQCDYNAGADEWNCTFTGDTSGEDGNVPVPQPGDPDYPGFGWDCTYNAAIDAMECVSIIPPDPNKPNQPGEPPKPSKPDQPDQQPGWVCEFPEGTDGGVKICVLEGDPNQPPPVTTGCPTGNIEGYSCTPSQEGVSGASVVATFTDCEGNQQSMTVQSDALGYFVFPGIPEGTVTLDISKGPYERQEQVTVTANQTSSFIDEDERLCFLPDAAKIAVVGGSYDAIEVVLDSLGFEYDFYPGDQVWEGWDFLLDAAAMSTYDIIFINCGVFPEANFVNHMAALQTIGQNVRNYVDADGYIYASDWAYYFVEAAWPEKLDFRGDDLNPYDVLVGQLGLHAVAITDNEMKAYTGLETATIFLDLPQWAILLDYNHEDPTIKDYLRGDAKLMDGSVIQNVPFLVDFPSEIQPVGGSVAYTSYHIHQNTPVNEFFTFIALNFK